jgi:vacuolar protein sorting-associated protein 13A/C
MDFQVQNSIVPKAFNLARFKVAGKLPTLHVNLSDTKYKTLMRLIDVAIPNFDDSSAPAIADATAPVVPAAGPVRPAAPTRVVSGGFTTLTTGLFGGADHEYNVDTDTEESDDQQEEQDEFFEVQEGDDAKVRARNVTLIRVTDMLIGYRTASTCLRAQLSG